jgi:hypothetical protein
MKLRADPTARFPSKSYWQDFYMVL